MFRLAQVPVLEANIHALGRVGNRELAADAVDTAILDALSQAKTFLAEGKAFANLTLYEQRLSRSLHKDLDLLRNLQREATKQPSKPRPVAAKPTPQPTDSTAPSPEIGFVYSTPPADPAPPHSSPSNVPKTVAA